MSQNYFSTMPDVHLSAVCQFPQCSEALSRLSPEESDAYLKSSAITELSHTAYPGLIWEARLYTASPNQTHNSKGFAGFWLFANLERSSISTRDVWASYRAALLNKNDLEMADAAISSEHFVDKKRPEYGKWRGYGVNDAFRMEDLKKAIHSDGSLYICLELTIFSSASDCKVFPDTLFREHLASCNECGQGQRIVGYRYKCLICDDYDLCSACEVKMHLHDRHPMIRISDARDVSWREKLNSASVVESRLKREIAVLEENRAGLNELVGELEQNNTLQNLELGKLKAELLRCAESALPADSCVYPNESVEELQRHSELQEKLAKFQVCSICFNEFSETRSREALYPCGHSTFCCKCIAQILSRERCRAIAAAIESARLSHLSPPNPDEVPYFPKCPTCRKDFTDKLRIFID